MVERPFLIMKKTAVIIFLLILANCCRAQRHLAIGDPNFSIEGLIKISQSYFRSEPYRKDFSKFLQHLLNDPTIINKTIRKKTDSTLFLFKGEYKGHSPYGFVPDRTEIRLTE